MNNKFLEKNLDLKVLAVLDVVVERPTFEEDEDGRRTKDINGSYIQEGTVKAAQTLNGVLLSYDDMTVTISGRGDTETCINIERIAYMQEYSHNS
tara:strand:+ start:602 stop:886 length:285 start_codon:yes stop_codon:yes gene_type:complete